METGSFGVGQPVRDLLRQGNANAKALDLIMSFMPPLIDSNARSIAAPSRSDELIMVDRGSLAGGNAATTCGPWGRRIKVTVT